MSCGVTWRPTFWLTKHVYCFEACFSFKLLQLSRKHPLFPTTTTTTLLSTWKPFIPKLLSFPKRDHERQTTTKQQKGLSWGINTNDTLSRNHNLKHVAFIFSRWSRWSLVIWLINYNNTHSTEKTHSSVVILCVNLIFVTFSWRGESSSHIRDQENRGNISS